MGEARAAAPARRDEVGIVTDEVQEAVAAAITKRLERGWFRGWQFPIEVGDLCYIVSVDLHESYEPDKGNRRKDGTYHAKNRKTVTP
jgi:hypothetical protein